MSNKEHNVCLLQVCGLSAGSWFHAAVHFSSECSGGAGCVAVGLVLLAARYRQ